MDYVAENLVFLRRWRGDASGWKGLRIAVVLRFSSIGVRTLLEVGNRIAKANASLPTAPSTPPLRLRIVGREKSTCPFRRGRCLSGRCPWVRLIGRRTKDGLRVANRQGLKAGMGSASRIAKRLRSGLSRRESSRAEERALGSAAAEVG